MTAREWAVVAIKASLLVVLMVAWAMIPAYANGSENGHNRGNGHDDGQTQATGEATATAESSAESTATSYSEGSTSSSSSEGGAATAAGGSASASNDGVTVEGGDTSFSSESNNTNVVLVPNNNTESCLRVWGISFGNGEGAGALGIPWRSAKCDYEQAADDAFAAGERELGWFWKCQNKNLAKRFRGDGETWEQAYSDCHAQMVGEITNVRTIETLKEKLAMSEDLRKIERERHERVTEQLNDQCDEAKGRIAEACRK